MRLSWGTVASVLVAALALHAEAWEGTSGVLQRVKAQDKGGVDALQGTWIVTAYGSKGKPTSPQKEDEDEPWIIKGNKLTIYDSVERNDIKGIVELKVDASKNPAHIDIFLKGKRKGKEMEWTTHGIYSLKGDELTLCLPEKFDPWEPENRPTEFKSTSPPKGKSSGFVVYVFKRKK